VASQVCNPHPPSHLRLLQHFHHRLLITNMPSPQTEREGERERQWEWWHSYTTDLLTNTHKHQVAKMQSTSHGPCMIVDYEWWCVHMNECMGTETSKWQDDLLYLIFILCLTCHNNNLIIDAWISANHLYSTRWQCLIQNDEVTFHSQLPQAEKQKNRKYHQQKLKWLRYLPWSQSSIGVTFTRW